MRAFCGLILGGLMFVCMVAGCAPKQLSPAELESALVGTWKDQKGMPIEFRADKTLTTPIDKQDRNGTWSLNAQSGEVAIEISEGQPRDGRTYPAATWTAYVSKDGRALRLYTLAPSAIEYAKKQLGKDPVAVLRKD
ncbi:hypothetical protein [Planctomyces sp. SH-PL14]|uniref:hypothetical protein n=1 Tax=Planctomyces sp. SH-PL14 TaxID=1632864 RepID=UPI00078C798E|nr:hypothetical protein [Planctomyces sp. SH-PL14]AMV19573.1 hypothetical protein VT03_16885 [Planctomyces sp. SH-PL14]